MLYLSKLESKLDEALSKETRESLTEWIGHKRNKPLNQNKMTAVEWLRKELLKRDIDTSIKELFEQAKEMEKEQIIIAYDKGDENGADRIYYHDIRNDVSAEQYYNQTFKSE